MAVVTIEASALPATTDQTHAWCAQLEAGDILFFPATPITLPPQDVQFLLGLQQTNSSLHKNIAYKPRADAISGLDTNAADAAGVARLSSIMRGYSHAVENFLSGFLAPYQHRWQLDYASFRPQEEQNRNLALRKRNDLLHTDAFPTRPTHGARILRFFNNIHPTRTRDWVVGDPFRTLAPRFAPKDIPLPAPESSAASVFKGLARGIGLGSAVPSLKRSPYDDFMMRFHNFLKENEGFQESAQKYPSQFPAGSSWMVYTDTVPHAVLAGQYALEQTFLVAHEAMVAPEHSPLTVLEKMAGAKLV
jgi:hypothetical protein